MKWAFVLFTAYSGPFGAFLNVLGCRESLPGLHEQYVSARWRQARHDDGPAEGRR